MGKGRRIKQARQTGGAVPAMRNDGTNLSRAVYDRLFYQDQTPEAANLYLLSIELEDYLRRHEGLQSEIYSVMKATAEDLHEFMQQNRGILIRLYGKRFPDPLRYEFPKDLDGDLLGPLVEEDRALRKALH